MDTKTREHTRPHLHEGLLGQLRGFKCDESLQAGRRGPVGDVAQAAGCPLTPGNHLHTYETSRRGGAHGHARRRADIDPTAGGAQGAGRTVGAHCERDGGDK